MRKLVGQLLVLLAAAAAAPAPAAAVPATPIPQEPNDERAFIGRRAEPKPVSAPEVPRHPFMAPNGRSNIHDDAYMTDTYEQSGPLGRAMEAKSTFLASDCASVTFDSEDRIVSICVGLEGPKLVLLDPDTLELLATMVLPPRQPSSTNPFTDFSGGGYFYLDHRDRAVVPTTNRHLYVVAETAGPGFRLERDYDLTSVVGLGDSIVSALPDFSGRIWFVSTRGVVGFVVPSSGAVRALQLPGEGITNSFSVDEDGGVYIVSDRALYRFEVGSDGNPKAIWRQVYENSLIQKPGQVDDGSGTTPTVMGAGLVAITDNADPMNVVVYKRGRTVTGGRRVCRQPVFREGQSATDNSLIVAGRAIVVENNYGYEGPRSTMNGGVTAPGIERVDLDADGVGCRRVWRSEEISPTVVPKLSLGNGLVYAYTKTRSENDPWYLTAIDFRTGATVFKRLSGSGLGFNNNYAPITIGPDGTAYVGVLGGLVLLRDTGTGGDDETGGGGDGDAGAGGDDDRRADRRSLDQTDPGAGETDVAGESAGSEDGIPFTGLALLPAFALGFLLAACGAALGRATRG